MLWLAVELPALPLEVFAADGHALAVCDAHTIQYANAVARAAGISAGQKRATALALAPQARFIERDLLKEEAALHAVAMWALQFTPNISLVSAQNNSSHGLLLEVSGSLRLFGGLARIEDALRRGLAVQGHRVRLGSAPVPHAAWLAARAGLSIVGLTELQEKLAPLPVSLLNAGQVHWEALHSIGAHTIGDVLALPRTGIARRFSQALLDELDCALGAKADPRPWFSAPPQFEVKLELAARVDNAQALLFAARRLIVQLSGWLLSRHAATRQLMFTLIHEDCAPTELPLQLADASNNEERFTALLREVLNKTKLAAPVYELALQCADSVAAAAPNLHLFAAPQQQQEGLTRLLERLQVRLGRGQVQRMRLHQDHRPEFAFRTEAAALAPPKTQLPEQTTHSTARPLWLLPRPLPLAERNNVPMHRTPLSLMSGPERIEAGWWDGQWAERDYFIARDEHNVLLWIFRPRIPTPDVNAQHGWFLHGRFG